MPQTDSIPQQSGLDSLAVRIAHVEADISLLQSSTTTATNTTNTATSTTTVSGLPKILSAKEIVQASTAGTVAWTTYTPSTLPSSAQIAILEIDYAITQPDVPPFDAYVTLRSQSGALEIIGAHGRSSGGSDANADCKQVMVWLSGSRQFDYKIDPIGFDAGCEIRIIGYI